MDEGISDAQCPRSGCARRLMALLRVSGCRVWGRVERPRRFGLPDALMITAESADAEALVLASDRALRTHWQRMLMLLWAEYGGAN